LFGEDELLAIFRTRGAVKNASLIYTGAYSARCASVSNSDFLNVIKQAKDTMDRDYVGELFGYEVGSEAHKKKVVQEEVNRVKKENSEKGVYSPHGY
jgi:hypothetical protein